MEVRVKYLCGVCCSVLQGVAGCCRVLQGVLQGGAGRCSVLQGDVGRGLSACVRCGEFVYTW